MTRVQAFVYGLAIGILVAVGYFLHLLSSPLAVLR